MNEADIKEYLEIKEILDKKGKISPTKRAKFARLSREYEKHIQLTEGPSKEENEALNRGNTGIKQNILLVTNRTVEATFRFIEAQDVADVMEVHPLNPRAQKFISTKAALWDILPLVEKCGVIKWGYTCVSEEDPSKLLAIDCSRRTKAAIYAHTGLPVWEIKEKLTDEEIEGLIKVSDSAKSHSRYELGDKYLDKYNELGTFAAVYKYYGIPKTNQKTVERNLKARLVDDRILNLFCDPMGIPNSYYGKLSIYENQFKSKYSDSEDPIAEALKDIHIEPLQYDSELNEEIVSQHMLSTLKAIEEKVNKVKEVPQPSWSEPVAVYQDSSDPNKYAKKKVHKNGRKEVYELSRLTKGQSKALDLLIESLDNPEKLKAITDILERE